MNTNRRTSPVNADRHAIVACDSKTRKITVVSVHENYDAALSAWQPLDTALLEARAEGDPHPAAWYAVRSVADPLVTNAICAQFKLGPKQAVVLSAIVAASDRALGTGRRGYADTGAVEHAQRSVTASYREGAAFHQISQIAKRLEALGLIVMRGVAYGPKTYRPTSLGRLLSETRRGEVAEAAAVAA